MKLQKASANQKFIVIAERRFDLIHVSIELKIQEVDVLFDELVRCEPRLDATDIHGIQRSSQRSRKFKVAVEPCVNDGIPQPILNSEFDDWNPVRRNRPSDQRLPPLT